MSYTNRGTKKMRRVKVEGANPEALGITPSVGIIVRVFAGVIFCTLKGRGAALKKILINERDLIKTYYQLC